MSSRTYQGVRSNGNDSESSTSYEVFRNMTTAVEVIVKEVPKSHNNSGILNNQDIRLTKRLKDDVDRLQNKLNVANSSLEKSRKNFKICIQEMKNQLDSAYQREAEMSTKYVAMQLENEKMRSYLNSKTNLINKLRKELGNMKRVIKFVVKNMIYVPQLNLTNLSCGSDQDDECGSLKAELKVKNATGDENTLFDNSSLLKKGTDTLNSTNS